MHVGDTRVLGKSGLPVTIMGFGGAPLGNMYQALSDDDARATVRACYEAGIRYFDTAPLYGYGLPSTASARRCAARARDELRAVDQGRPPAPAGRSRDARARPVQGRAAVRRGLRLLLRRRHALGRGQPAAPRHAPHRHPAGARPRRLDPRLRGGAAGAGRRVHGGRLPRDGRAARAGRGPRDRRRRQRDRGLPGPRRARRLRLLPARRALHPARAGAARRVPAAVRAAQHRADHRRRLQHRHPRHRRGRGRLFPIRAGAARDHGAGAPDRGGLRPPRRAPADRGAAVPARPSGGRDGDPRHPRAGRGRAEPRDLRARGAGRLLGRAQARRPAARRRRPTP